MDAAGARRAALRRWVKISGIALVCAFGGLSWSAVVSNREARYTADMIARRALLHRFDQHLREFVTLVTDAETSQRGFLLTGRSLYLAPYSTAARQALAGMGSLNAPPLDDPALRAHLRNIRSLAASKLAELGRTISLYQSGRREAAMGLVQSDVGQQAMEQVRQEAAASATIVQMALAANDAAIVKRTRRGQQLEDATLVAVLLCAVFAAVQMGSLWVVQARYERELSTSERRHRAIVEDQTELIAISNPQGGLEFVNPAYAQFFGIDAEDLDGRTLYDSLSGTERQEWVERMALAIDKNDCLLREQQIAGPARPRWVAWRHRVRIGSDGRTRIHSVGRDISLRKRAEEALQAREEFLERIGRVAGVGGWSLTLKTGAVHWSEGVRKIYEVPEAFVPDYESAMSFYPPRVQVVIQQAVDRAIETHEPWDLEVPMTTDKGRQIWVRAVGEVELDDAGKPIRLVGALQDITERKAIERSLRELTDILENTSDFIAQTDWRGMVQYMNPAARTAVGLALDAPVTGRRFSDYYTPKTNELFVREIVPTVKRQDIWVGETQVVLKGGRVVPISHMVIGHKDAVGRVARYTSVMRDISAEVAANQELARKTATLDAIVEAIPSVLSVWDAGIRYQLVNRAFERARGLDRRQMVGRTMQETLGAEEFERSLPWIRRALAGETVSYEKEYPHVSGSGQLSVTYTPLRSEDGAIGGFVELAHDITHHSKERQRLAGLAEHDPLTGLLNRAGLEAYLIARTEAGQLATLACLYIDLDHFKPVNDRFGHAAGDEVLRQFASRLKAIVRPTDAVARLGGDEFAVILADVREPTHAELVADKVVEAAQMPFCVEETPVLIGASVGVAYDAQGPEGWKGLIARADARVYEAKAAGRGRRSVA